MAFTAIGARWRKIIGAMKKQRKAKKDSSEEADDWCFLCKDGGDLIICDHKGCLKVYHADCVGKDETSLETGKRWICDRHTCFVCRKSAKIYCFCCPNAVCGKCASAAEFAKVRGDGGFCDECVKLILLIEENVDCDSDGEKLDFEDRDTQECLFKEYWEIIKEREGLSLENVYSADTRLKKAENKNRGRDAPIEISDGEGSDESAYEIDAHETDEDDNVQRSRGKRTYESASESDGCDKMKRARSKRKRSNGKFLEFEGWGSKPLIHFLSAIGEDTTKELSRFDVDTIISRYIQEKNLFHQGKGRKKKVHCDEKLYAIFRKKTLNKHLIYHLLERHFVETKVPSDEDEEDDDSGNIAGVRGRKNTRAVKKLKSSSYERKSKEKRLVSKIEKVPKVPKVPEIQKSCFAAINNDNLKLVYLRRSFVEELLKQSQTAEGKIVGSFVKVKMDPTYYLNKSSHQLLQVTGLRGLKQGSTVNNSMEILLELSSLSKPVSIKMLSDNDLSAEECEDLRERMENGTSKKPTVMELQLKAASLHEDITKLVYLNLVWSRTKDEYLERKALLKTPSEQERRLKRVPKVIPENGELNSSASPPSSGDDSDNEDESADSDQPCSRELRILRASPL
ncbi:hypothetical protein CRG98_021884 [Punica granatum]|uniref:Uncharacterized protein n=1 Tax=Punica granatum TaxID=22663 RepID=A0A2I0JNF0_PUNGR|nr:hypothetical protein CRG98_021884 [Punica granatum]